MNKLKMILCMTVGTFALIVPAFAKTDTDQGRGQAIVTVLSKTDIKAPVNIPRQNLQVKVNGKEASVTDWVPLSGPNSDLELVILIDSSALSNLGSQFRDIADVIQNLPSNMKVSVAYMDAGRAILAAPLSTNHAQVAGDLRLPYGTPGASASPYFCLSDLAKHWPSNDLAARREVVLITDGVDNYYPRFDPQDPYVAAAIADSVRARLVVYSIYWRNRGRLDDLNYESFDGQSLLSILTEATGGFSYGDGRWNSVSLKPYFEDILWRLQNQYLLSFQSPLKGRPEVQRMALKISGLSAEVSVPRRVFVEQSR